jgi:citronellol/citronellal dehydrogenase
MTTHSKLAGRTIVMSGGSRGIGLAIAIRAARDGANIALIAKTDTPHPRLPGTIHTAADEIRDAGGAVLPIVGDIRDPQLVEDAVQQTVERFGGIDIVVNNASAIDLRGVGHLTPKAFNLMLDVNVRGTYQLTHFALPHLERSGHGQIVTLSPPLDLDRRWLAQHSPYTLSKYGMTMLTLGVAEQYRDRGVAAYCLWPRTLIATAAIRNVVGGEAGMRASRTPEIMADAAYELLTTDSTDTTGRCHVDTDVLRTAGIVDLAPYAVVPGTPDEDLTPDLFV